MKRILLILISILTLSSQAMSYEEANYKVVKENKEYEIRKYSDRLVIETNSIEGNGFRKLFNYISGNNEKNQEIKMTWSETYQSDGVNQVGLITDSWGMISIFAKNKNASEIIGIVDGEKINIKK